MTNKEYKNDRVEISNTDLWTMLLSTIRYSMGRMTYMPSTCISMCKEYGKYLNTAQQSQIIKEIKKEVELYDSSNRKLGMDCDHTTWKSGWQELSQLWNINLEER